MSNVDRVRLMGSKEKSLPKFGGFNVAPCNTMWDGSKYIIPYDDWKHTSEVSDKKFLFGQNSGSYFFSYHYGLAYQFDSRGTSYSPSTGPIDLLGTLVSYGEYDDWRIPTFSELNDIIIKGTGRNGSIVNGTSGIKYCLVRVTDYALDPGLTKTFGILVFPDNRIINGAAPRYYNSYWISRDEGQLATEMTVAQLDTYCEKGCIYIPDAGYAGIGNNYGKYGGQVGYGYCSYWCLDFESGGGNAYAYKLQIANGDGSLISGGNYEYFARSSSMVRGYYNLLRLIRTAD